MLGTVLGTSQRKSHSILVTALWDRYYYIPILQMRKVRHRKVE